MSRILRNYNEQEGMAFRRLFDSNEYKKNPIYESIGSKMYRHEYCLVGNDMVEEVTTWFQNCGLNVKQGRVESFQTEIELV